MAPVTGIGAAVSQSTLGRFVGIFPQRSCQALSGLHAGAPASRLSHHGGDTLDLDSWALLHEDGVPQVVAVGCTRPGLEPCHRRIIAGLAESK